MASSDPSVIDVEHFLDTLEVRNMRKATINEMRFSCPLPQHPGEDNDPSCYMNIHTTAFFCHGCKGRGTAVTLTSEVLGISPLEATRMLRQAYSRGGLDPDARKMTDEMRKLFHKREEMVFQPQLDEAVLKRFYVDWADAYCEWDQTKDPQIGYMFERGFEPEWLMDWNFGYDLASGRITIPIRDEHGVLVGFKARAMDDRHPKYLVLGDMAEREGSYGFKRYFPSRVVFGAYRYFEPDTHVDQVVVHEGELNAIACYEKTGMPSVAINGSHFSDHHAKIIRRIANEAVLFLDEDSAGEDCVWGWTDSKGEFHKGIVDHLARHMPVRIIREHTQDAADLPAEEIERLVKDSRSVMEIFLGMS